MRNWSGYGKGTLLTLTRFLEVPDLLKSYSGLGSKNPRGNLYGATALRVAIQPVVAERSSRSAP